LNGEVVSGADILAAIFATTSSARTRVANGILMPGDFAALRSMTVANVAGRMTGIWAKSVKSG